MWVALKIKGIFLGGSYKRDYRILGSMLGFPILGNYHFALTKRLEQQNCISVWDGLGISGRVSFQRLESKGRATDLWIQLTHGCRAYVGIKQFSLVCTDQVYCNTLELAIRVNTRDHVWAEPWNILNHRPKREKNKKNLHP